MPARAHVAIRVSDPDEDAGQLEVEVDDDGVGFDPERVDGGFGLLGMRERLALFAAS